MLKMVLHNSIKQSIYVCRRAPYPDWFGCGEIWCPPTCMQGSFTKLDNAECLRISDMVL